MPPVPLLTDFLLGLVPEPPQAAATGVLWAGPQYARETLVGLMGNASWALVGLGLLIPVMAACFAYPRRWRDSISGEETWAPAAPFLPLLAVGLILAVIAGVTISSVGRRASTLIVLKPDGVGVVLTDALRRDIPSGAVRAVERTTDTVRLVVHGFPSIEIAPGTAAMPALNVALDGMMAARSTARP